MVIKERAGCLKKRKEERKEWKEGESYSRERYYSPMASLALTQYLHPADELVAHNTHKHARFPVNHTFIHLPYIQYLGNCDMLRLMAGRRRRRYAWVGKGSDMISRAQW